ncbi:MAG TPA: DUF4388 domain-containing protein [Pyrinomonadaceae bacterium]|jgi:tetratricopeptide (TPR) repeat protein
MSDGAGDSPKSQDEEIETALLDAELFLKYKAPQRAVKRLLSAIEEHPRSVVLREKLRECAATHKLLEEAARQCLALANLYIAREDFETAHERLLQAKHFDPRISIATGLEAIRRARRPELAVPRPDAHAATTKERRIATLSGDLSIISIFDVVQVLENSRLTGAITVDGFDKQQKPREGRILFNEGRIVGAESTGATAIDAFRLLVEITDGSFEFEKSAQEFPVQIQALSNTNLILDTLRQLDEENQ